jgi:hypothetical protein
MRTQFFEKELLEMKFEKIMALLRELPKHVDAQRLMEVSMGVSAHPYRTVHVAPLYCGAIGAAQRARLLSR